MTPGRLKSLSLLTLLALSGLVLLSWSQVWFTVTVAGTAYEVAGSPAAEALLPLALCALLVVPALAIAGPLFRVVLGILQALLGVCVVLQAMLAIGDPVAASRRVVSDATGIEGGDSTAALVDGVSSAPWPWLAVVAGGLLVLAGLAVAVTSRSWPGSARRYERVRFEDAEGATVLPESLDGGSADASASPASSSVPPAVTPPAAPSRSTSIDDWDALSQGDDPTSTPR